MSIQRLCCRQNQQSLSCCTADNPTPRMFSVFLASLICLQGTVVVIKLLNLLFQCRQIWIRKENNLQTVDTASISVVLLEFPLIRSTMCPSLLYFLQAINPDMQLVTYRECFHSVSFSCFSCEADSACLQSALLCSSIASSTIDVVPPFALLNLGLWNSPSGNCELFLLISAQWRFGLLNHSMATTSPQEEIHRSIHLSGFTPTSVSLSERGKLLPCSYPLHSEEGRFWLPRPFVLTLVSPLSCPLGMHFHIATVSSFVSFSTIPQVTDSFCTTKHYPLNIWSLTEIAWKQSNEITLAEFPVSVMHFLVRKAHFVICQEAYRQINLLRAIGLSFPFFLVLISLFFSSGPLIWSLFSPSPPLLPYTPPHHHA